VNILVSKGLGLFFVLLFRQKDKNHLQTMARALFENTRNPGKKVGSTAYEPKRPFAFLPDFYVFSNSQAQRHRVWAGSRACLNGHFSLD
jgi:hypothetical protein